VHRTTELRNATSDGIGLGRAFGAEWGSAGRGFLGWHDLKYTGRGGTLRGPRPFHPRVRSGARPEQRGPGI